MMHSVHFLDSLGNIQGTHALQEKMKGVTVVKCERRESIRPTGVSGASVVPGASAGACMPTITSPGISGIWAEKELSAVANSEASATCKEIFHCWQRHTVAS